jgi:TonB family protein
MTAPSSQHYIAAVNSLNELQLLPGDDEPVSGSNLAVSATTENSEMTRRSDRNVVRTATFTAAVLFLIAAGVAAQDGFRVVVNPQNPVSSLSRTQISKLFLERATWDDGGAVAPVDLLPTSPIREGFSRDLLGVPIPTAIDRSRGAAKAAGANPPPSMASDREVLAFVRLKPGAIGYVSLAADVSGVKVVSVGGKTDHVVEGLSSSREPLAVGGRIPMPQRLVHAQPVYPQIARTGRIQGTVEVSIVVDAFGNVEQAKVVRSIAQLDSAAVEAVRKWKYTPTVVNGVAVPVTMVVHVAFAL